MTKHVATVNDIVQAVKSPTYSVDRVLPLVIDADFMEAYNSSHAQVDALFGHLYAQYVIYDVSKPTELGVEGDLLDELSALSIEFLTVCKTALNRLWELEKLTFNPVENYDRFESLQNVKTGSESVSYTKSGTEQTTTTPQGDLVVKNVQSGDVKSTNAGGTKSTTNNSATAYDTNNVDITVVDNVDTTSNTTTYEGVTNIETTTNTQVVKSETVYNDRVDTDTHEYNAITDTQTNHIHGNIGVTTSTSMAIEYDNYYKHYSFWTKMWEMYINLFASPIFETDRTYYQEV